MCELEVVGSSRKLFVYKCFGRRYIGPYEVLERIGPVAYQLAFPPNLSRVYDVFQLRKCVADPDAVLETTGSTAQPDHT